MLTFWRLVERIAAVLAARTRVELAQEFASMSSRIDAATTRLEAAQRPVDDVRPLLALQARQHALAANLPSVLAELELAKASVHVAVEHDEGLARTARNIVRHYAGLPPAGKSPDRDQLLGEVTFIWRNCATLRPVFELLKARRVLYAGQAYYNAWYLSRALRKLGWRADVLNWDGSPAGQMHYHGQDYLHGGMTEPEVTAYLEFYIDSLYRYDLFHFSNAHALSFGGALGQVFADHLAAGTEVRLLKLLGKKIAYSNNGCLDGVSQTMFARWPPESHCDSCRWRDEPSVCSDERNLAWGAYRNSLADYQINIGSNRADYNADTRVHEGPGFYCLDPDIWRPELDIPEQFRIERRPGQVILYHAVGNRSARTGADGRNVKSTHLWHPIVEKLRSEGWDILLLEPDGIHNMDVRYLQAQADIFLEMLAFGWFGANAREAMMLGKPVVSFIRPQWLQSVAVELPEYAAALPIVSARPETAEAVLLDLMRNPDKRAEIGRRSREFMLRWHSPQYGARVYDDVYRRLLGGEQLLRHTTVDFMPRDPALHPRLRSS